MRFRRIVIGAICVILSVSPAWSAPRGIGDTGGIKGAASPQLKKLSPKAGAACFRA